jgi:signal transduction histidine kinase
MKSNDSILEQDRLNGMGGAGEAKPFFHASASALAVALIFAIAFMTAAGLMVLVRLYKEAYKASATVAVLQRGIALSRHLAMQPVLAQSEISASDFDRFTEAFLALSQAEESLGHVTITEDGAVVYHKQFEAPGSSVKPGGGERVIIERKKMTDGSSIVPMITFTRDIALDDGRERRMEMALRKEMLDREHAAATSAVTDMFVASLVIIAAAFALCLLIIIWLLHREARWQKRRRQSEHLAFAGAVAASVIHDFRNPMSALQLDAQMLQKEAEEECDATRVSSLAARISKTVARTDDLLKEFLLFSRPDTVMVNSFDMNTCVRDCVDLVGPRLKSAGIGVEIKLHPVPLKVSGSPTQMRRALLNVLNNASNFAPPGTNVDISTRDEGNQVVVEIRDYGSGILSKAEREKIFEFFYSTRPGGTGIGLALARTAVENCGGRIRCLKPENGPGSSFVMEIPLSKE